MKGLRSGMVSLALPEHGLAHQAKSTPRSEGGGLQVRPAQGLTWPKTESAGDCSGLSRPQEGGIIIFQGHENPKICPCGLKKKTYFFFEYQRVLGVTTRILNRFQSLRVFFA